MNNRIIRYKKPEWTSWVYLTVNEKDVGEVMASLIALGYEVEA